MKKTYLFEGPLPNGKLATMQAHSRLAIFRALKATGQTVGYPFILKNWQKYSGVTPPEFANLPENVVRPHPSQQEPGD